MLAREEALSPILLPSADFKKPGQLYKSPRSSPEQSIYVHTSGLVPSQPTSSQHGQTSHVSSVLTMVYFPHRGLGLPFLVLLHVSARHYGGLCGPNGITSNSSNSLLAILFKHTRRSTVKNSRHPRFPLLFLL